MHRLSGLLSLVVVFISVSAFGEDFDRSKFAKFKPGSTTKAQIVEALGKPTDESNTLDGRAVIGYEYPVSSNARDPSDKGTRVSIWFSPEDRLVNIYYRSYGGIPEQIAEKHRDAIQLLGRLTEFFDGCQKTQPPVDRKTAKMWVNAIEGTVEYHLYQSRRLEYLRVKQLFLAQQASETEFAVARINYDGATERYGMRRADIDGSQRAIANIESTLVECQKRDEQLRMFKISNFTSRLRNALFDMVGLVQQQMASAKVPDATSAGKPIKPTP